MNSGVDRNLEHSLGDNLVFVRLLLSCNSMCKILATPEWIRTLLGIVGQLNANGMYLWYERIISPTPVIINQHQNSLRAFLALRETVRHCHHNVCLSVKTSVFCSRGRISERRIPIFGLWVDVRMAIRKFECGHARMIWV